MSADAVKTPANPWRTGHGAPSAGLGNDGDLYTDLDTGRDYQRSAGAYGLIFQATLPTSKLTGTLPVGSITGTLPQTQIAGQPTCRAYRSTGSPFTLVGPGWVAIPFDQEQWDTDTMHDNTTNPSRITCKTAGIYLVTAGAHVAGASAGGTIYGVLAKSGSVAAGDQNGETQFGPVLINAGGELRLPAMVGVFSLAVNDWVEMFLYYNVAGSCSVDNAAEGVTHLTAVRLSA